METPKCFLGTSQPLLIQNVRMSGYSTPASHRPMSCRARWRHCRVYILESERDNLERPLVSGTC